MSDAPAKPDYRATVFLPKTDFPMKAGLPQKEPLILAKWQEGDLYGQVRAARDGREKFILHDGPPYANGDIHIGHALNHILKDMVVRTQTLLGKDAPYVPGWDCHGLPIEWKVEEQYRKKKLNKDDVPLVEFRAECRAYAQHWVNTQREQLKRLGIGGRWDKPYLTMNYEAEGTIVAELMKFAESGQLYRGAKPVMWSPVEKTALAEAEIEYEDVVSTQIDVAFEIVESAIPELVGAHAVVWTTTPWTIPVNQAIAYGAEVEYELIEWGAPLKRYLVASPLAGALVQRLSSELARDDNVDVPDIPSEFHEVLVAHLDELEGTATAEGTKRWRGTELAGTIARHPLAVLFDDSIDNWGTLDERFVKEQQDPSYARLINIRDRAKYLTEFYDGVLVRDSALKDFYLRPRPFVAGDFVTTDSGTGLVHMSPDHGEDDFELCKANGIDPVFAVEGDGKYRQDWPWLGGQGSVINAKFNAPDGAICRTLKEVDALVAASADYKHSYPHSWRSKAKVIYRCTPQWFIAMDKAISSPLVGEDQGGGRGASASQENLSAADAAGSHPNPSPQGGGSDGPTLRQLAINAIADTRFIPGKGRNRISSMVEGRPDWVISRQRAWGVPIALFVERKTGMLLVDEAVNARIVAAINAGGVDAWSDERAQEYLGHGFDAADYERITDILDVWFDSGCTHVFTLESGEWPEQQWPADLYLEGSDQHRGWFQSSLLESCGTRGRAPYRAVLTHGFTMDAKGLKMSKSVGNTINPLDLMRDYGADILRLWALSVDFTEDHRIGKEILAGVADQYRKLRNTFRYLLGALDGFEESERVSVEEMPELERYMLSLLAALDERLKAAIEAYDFNDYVRALADFANEDLSAFFFDIRKDSLYCDAATDPKRRAYRTVLDILFHALVRWAAPVLVFTSEEVWGTRYPDGGSVHLLEWPMIDTTWRDAALQSRWSTLRRLRSEVTTQIEPMRRDKTIGSSLEADIVIALQNEFAPAELGQTDLAELLITSTARSIYTGDIENDLAKGTFSAPLGVVGATPISVIRTTNQKCGRCWRHLPEVTEDGDLCARCEDVVNA